MKVPGRLYAGKDPVHLVFPMVDKSAGYRVNAMTGHIRLMSDKCGAEQNGGTRKSRKPNRNDGCKTPRKHIRRSKIGQRFRARPTATVIAAAAIRVEGSPVAAGR